MTGFAIVLLCVLLLIASWYDIRSNRIPNWLVLCGTVTALTLHSTLPAGFGFVSEAPGAIGFLASLKGVGLGFALFMPFYLLRLMGAGDVKLMAMVGAFLGISDVVLAVLGTFLAGGILTLTIGLSKGVLVRTLQNIRFMITSSAVKMYGGSLPTFDDAPATAAKLPYGVAIALGTIGYIAHKANKVGLL